MDLKTTVARFELTFDAKAHNPSGYRTDITVSRRAKQDEHFDLPTDEGTVIGGTGTAPYPLAYFAAGLAGCLATHLRSFSGRLKVPVTDIAMNTRCHWEARQAGDATYAAAPIAFTIDIDLGGGASDADKRRLIETASKACFVEQSLKEGTVKHRLKVGADWVAL